MLRAIVPGEVARWHRHGNTVVEDAFHIVERSVFLVESAGLEEARWRHLLRVAHTNERLTTGNGTHGLARWHLRSLVEHNDVELLAGQINVLRHADRAHQHAWAESWQKGWNLVDNLTDGHASSLRTDILLQDAHFRSGCCRQRDIRYLGSQFGIEFLLGQFLEFLRHAAVLLYHLLEEQTVEGLQLRLLVNHFDGLPLIHGLEQCLGSLRSVASMRQDVLDSTVESFALQFFLLHRPKAPVVRLLRVGAPYVEQRTNLTHTERLLRHAQLLQFLDHGHHLLQVLLRHVGHAIERFFRLLIFRQQLSELWNVVPLHTAPIGFYLAEHILLGKHLREEVLVLHLVPFALQCLHIL